MSHLVPRALRAALLASILGIGCSPESPVAPEADTKQPDAPQANAVQVVPNASGRLFVDGL